MAPTLLYACSMKAQLRWTPIGAMISGVAVAAALTACNVAPPEATQFPSVANNGMEDQGRFLLGATLDSWPGAVPGEHFSVSTQALTAAGLRATLSIPSAALLASTKPIVDLELTGGPAATPVRLRINLITQVPPLRPTLTKVRLEQWSGTGWTLGPCGAALAIPLAGVFQRDGLHVARADRITFACDEEGVSAKCADWGYPPGPTAGGIIWDTHQACTRMARSDICSDGIPHTRSHTRIWFYDTIRNNAIPDAVQELVQQPLDVWPPPPDIYYFEAMWRPGIAHAGCLSKLRWQALRVGALCGGLLPDPRTPSNSDGIADVCEDVSIEDAIEDGGAILFNKTQYSDLALIVWRTERPGGFVDYTTTVRGFIGGGNQETVHPFWEHVGDVYQPLAPEAYLMRVPPVGVGETEYAAVSTFVHPGGDRVLARTADPLFGPDSGYVREFDEGFVLVAGRDGARAELWIWRSPVTGDRVAITGYSTPPGGYMRERFVGFITDPDGL